MRELFTQFVEWLHDNYKIMSGIVVHGGNNFMNKYKNYIYQDL